MAKCIDKWHIILIALFFLTVFDLIAVFTGQETSALLVVVSAGVTIMGYFLRQMNGTELCLGNGE